jgi:arylsulfatase A-like enzyme
MVYHQPVISLDIFATIAALSGAPTNPDRPLDGVNLTPYISGQIGGRPHEATYLRQFDSGRFMVRSGDFKLVVPGRDEQLQLFNLTSDLGETTNLAAVAPDIRDQLKQKLDSWTGELIEPRFLGLIHTAAYQKRQQENQQKSGKTKNN